MSQKPLRVTRIPKTFDLPPAAYPGVVSVPSGAVACPACTAYVADLPAHLRYHDTTDRWARRVNEVLQIVLRALRAWGAIPTDDDTPATGGDTPANGGDTNGDDRA